MATFEPASVLAGLVEAEGIRRGAGHKWFRSRGLFVGSGAVEPGCKAVIGQRLKLPGMHWTITGADAITTLRCQQASRPEDQIWHAARNQRPAA